MTFAYRKICMIGPGSIGGVVAAKLARAGFDVSALARRPRAERLNTKGLTLTGVEGDFTVPLRASDKAADLGKQDLVLIATKYNNLPEILDALPVLCGPETPLVFLLNGVPWWFFEGFPGPHAGARLTSVDPDGLLARKIPTRNLVWSTVTIGSEDWSDGRIWIKNSGDLVIGRADNATTKLDDIAAVLRAGKIDTEVSTDIRSEVWTKLQANASINPVGALSLSGRKEMFGDPIIRGLVFSIVDEVRQIGAALGLNVSDKIPNMMRQPIPAGPSPRSSMLQDIDRGRPPEIDALVGAVVEIADKIGVPAPFLKVVFALLRARMQAAAAPAA